MVHVLRRHGARAEPARPRPSDGAPGPAVAAVLYLQRRAGNAAVTRLVQESRRVLARQPKGGGPVTHTFVIGKDVTVDFAAAAKRLSKDGKVTPDELPELRELALKRGTDKDHPEGSVGDAERMFMAGLLDPANAALVGKTNVTHGTRVTLSFAPASTATNLRTAADVRRGRRSAGPTDATKHILYLAGTDFEETAKAVVAFASAAKVPPADVLEAMLAAASDSTAADQVLAGAVYAIAMSARHPLAGDVRAGNIKVDAVSKMPTRPRHPGAAAAYASHGSGGREKGDTLYVSPKLKLGNLNDRSLVIHELEHAAHDKALHSGDLADEELSAYRAQAKYALEQITSGDRSQGITDIADGWNIGLVCGSVLVGRADPGLESLVREINKKSKYKNKPTDQMLFRFFRDDDFLAHGAEMLRAMENIPTDATTDYEGLRGESLLQAGKP